MAFGNVPFQPRDKASPGSGLDFTGLLKKLVDRYVVQKLYQIERIDIAANATHKVRTGDQQASLVYITVLSGTLDLHAGDIGTPGATAIPLTRVQITGVPFPFALPPDTYTWTVHAANATALRACVIVTSA